MEKFRNNKEGDMEVETIREMIRKHAIPRSTVAKLSGLWLTDLSAWLNGRQDLAADRVARVQQTVVDIVKLIEAMPMRVDLRDPANVAKLIVAVNDAQMQVEMFAQPAEPAPDLETLRLRPA
jgi:hypothetical protein